MTIPEAPAGVDGRLWSEYGAWHCGRWEESDGIPLRLLVEASVRLREVGEAIRIMGLSVEGSMGQPRLNPMVPAERELRSEVEARARAWSHICTTIAPARGRRR